MLEQSQDVYALVLSAVPGLKTQPNGDITTVVNSILINLVASRGNPNELRLSCRNEIEECFDL